MSAKPSSYPVEKIAKLAAEPPGDPVAGDSQQVAARTEIARRCTYLGDYERTAAALAPYLADGERATNELLLSKVEPPSLRANLLVEIALLLNHYRRYSAAVELIQRAIDLYDAQTDHYHQANAYHWLAFTRLNQHNFLESERCDLKAMELLFQRANQDQRRIGAPGEANLSHAIATSRIWLGILAQRQGLLMKAKAELYTARDLMQAASDGAHQNKDPRAWGDLYSTLGRVYSCEGRYDEALEETAQAIDYYSKAGHLIFEIQTRINLARIYAKRMASSDLDRDDAAAAKHHLGLAAAALESRLPQGDLRTACLLHLTYSWYYFARQEWLLAKKLAEEAIAEAKKLASNSLLADCYRARADALIQLHKLLEGRRDLQTAMECAGAASQFKTLGAVVLSFARSYCSRVDPDQVDVDKYLDRFVELRARHTFESRYLDDLYEKIKQDRLELPSQRAFYFSLDDLLSTGYDAGLARYLTWAIRSARSLSHGDMKKMTEALHFNTLSRTYKYDKIARALESGKSAAVETVNKTHTVRRNRKK
jgi:tetratricopeptide (TPR) repeat protein